MAPLRVAERSLDLIQRAQRAGFVEALTTDITNIDFRVGRHRSVGIYYADTYRCASG